MLLKIISKGALRLPDGPKKPLTQKPVKRKPLESVVRYLGKKKNLYLECLVFLYQFQLGVVYFIFSTLARYMVRMVKPAN